MAAFTSPPLGKVTFVILAGVPLPQSVSSALIVPPFVILATTVPTTAVLADSQPVPALQLT